MENKYVLLFLSACALIFAPGCATTMRVDTVTPSFNITRRITDTPANHATVIFEVFTVATNAQSAGNVIGEAKVGLFNSAARIVDSAPPADTVARAVKRGFQDAGFSLGDSGKADFTVSGSLERFWVDEHATGLSLEYSKASVQFDLIIKNRQGAIVWAKTLEQFKTSGKSMDTTANNLPTLSLALKGAVEKIFSDSTFWDAVGK